MKDKLPTCHRRPHVEDKRPFRLEYRDGGSFASPVEGQSVPLLEVLQLRNYSVYAMYPKTRQVLQPTPLSSIQLRRVLVKEGLWVVEAIIDYGGGQVVDAVLILELRDRKMWRDRWYFAQPFEAPEWRAQWVERMES